MGFGCAHSLHDHRYCLSAFRFSEFDQIILALLNLELDGGGGQVDLIFQYGFADDLGARVAGRQFVHKLDRQLEAVHAIESRVQGE